jgi:hypothetical protein
MVCVSTSKIGFDLMCNHKTEDSELAFAVARAWELLVKLQKDYYAAWHDERPGRLHTIQAAAPPVSQGGRPFL